MTGPASERLSGIAAQRQQLLGNLSAERERPDAVTYDAHVPKTIYSALQTAAYARASMELFARHAGWTTEEFDEAVESRLAAGRRLLANVVSAKTIVMEQASLRHQKGSPAVMAEATAHLGTLFENPPPNTTLKLIPEVARPGTELARGYAGAYIVTASQVNGVKVWDRDGVQPVPHDSYAANSILFDRDLLVRGVPLANGQADQYLDLAMPTDEAVALIAEETTWWESRIR